MTEGFGGRTVIPSAFILRMEKAVSLCVPVMPHTVIMSTAVQALQEVSLSTKKKYKASLKSNCKNVMLRYSNNLN